MITSIAKFLNDLKEVEATKLKAEKITHAPTIGAMYEGLTRDILDRAIPAELDLRIVDGFIEGVDDRLSHQVDAMLVTGEGREIPHTDGHVWPIKDVIAVFEVKKNLFGADLEDGFGKLRTVMHMHGEFVQTSEEAKVDIIPAYKAFARLTGLYPRNWEEADALPDNESFIFHALVSEQIAPVRILIGYEGYADEYSLRKGLTNYVEDNVKVGTGFGITSFPNLIICRNNALLKMSGQPYISPIVEDGWWPAIASNSENPLRLLVELIWTRLSNQFHAQFPVDDNLQMECLAPLISAHIGKVGEQFGWNYKHDKLPRKILSAIEPTSWEPEETDTNEWVLLMQVAKAGEFDIHDEEFRKWGEEDGIDLDALISSLVQKRQVAWCDNNTIRCISTGTIMTGFMPDGRVITTDDTDMLGVWMGSNAYPSTKPDE
jgi:hypothetical protein